MAPESKSAPEPKSHFKSETKSRSGPYSPEYLQLNYDRSTGKVWTDFFSSLGHNNWTKYQDENVLNCGNLCAPHTMQEIADRIRDAVHIDDLAKDYVP